MSEHRGPGRRAAARLSFLVGLATVLLGVDHAQAQTSEIVRIGGTLGVLKTDQAQTNLACAAWNAGAPSANACTCCIAHKYARGDGLAGIQNACNLAIGGVTHCNAGNPAAPVAASAAVANSNNAIERIALNTFVAKRFSIGNTIAGAAGGGNNGPFNADLAHPLTAGARTQLMDLLDAAKVGQVPFPPAGGQDPFAGGNALRRNCIEIAAGAPGVFTIRIYFIKYNDVCHAANPAIPWVANPGANPADVYTTRYVVKVLASPEGELFNLEDLKDMLTANNYPFGANANNPAVTGAATLPDIALPTGTIAFMAGATRRYMTIMPVALGKELRKFAPALEAANPAINPPWAGLGAAAAGNAAHELYLAWRAVGQQLGNFHHRFMGPAAGGNTNLGPTVVHGDFHQDNVFYDVATGKVTFIDAESMQGSMKGHALGGAAAAPYTLAPAWLDFVRPFNFQCCLDNLAFAYARVNGTNVPALFPATLLARATKMQVAELTIRPMLNAYIERLQPNIVAGSPAWEVWKADIWRAFNRNATVLSYATGHTGIAGVKSALYSPLRYHNWKSEVLRPMLANLHNNNGGL